MLISLNHALTHRLSFFDTIHSLKYNEWLKAKGLTPYANRSNHQNLYTRTSHRLDRTFIPLFGDEQERLCMCEREIETKRTRTGQREQHRNLTERAVSTQEKQMQWYANYLCVLTLFCQFLCVSLVPTHSFTIHPTSEIYKIQIKNKNETGSMRIIQALELDLSFNYRREVERVGLHLRHPMEDQI